MKPIGTFLRYDCTTDVDPFTSVVAAHGKIVVIGTLYGEIYLIADARRQLIYTHHGSIVELQVRECTLEGKKGHLYVICATSLGYIYVHLVCRYNLGTSRVIVKLRTGQEIVGLAVNPKFAWRPSGVQGDCGSSSRECTPIAKATEGRQVNSSSWDKGVNPVDNRIKGIGGTSGPAKSETNSDSDSQSTTVHKLRETYDLRKCFVNQRGKKQDHRGTIRCNGATVIFAAQKGGIYILSLEKLDTGRPEKACRLLHKSKPIYRRMPMNWHGDMISWADEDGTQILFLPKCAPVAFLPHYPPLVKQDRKPDTVRSYTPLDELVDLDEFYVTSEESEIDDSGENHGTTSSTLGEIPSSTDNGRHIDGESNNICASKIHLDKRKHYDRTHVVTALSSKESLPCNSSHDALTLIQRLGTHSTGDVQHGCIQQGIHSERNMAQKVTELTSDLQWKCETSTDVENDIKPHLSIGSSKSDMSSHVLEDACPVSCEHCGDVLSHDAYVRKSNWRRRKLGTAIKAHGIGASKATYRIHMRESIDVVIYWLSRKKLLVGTNNVIRVVDILPACVEDMDDVFGNTITKGRMKLLDTTKNSCQSTNKILPQLLTMVEKKSTKGVPFRGRISYTFSGPQTCRVVSIMKHTETKGFSIIYSTDVSSIGSEVTHLQGGHECSEFELTGTKQDTFDIPILGSVGQPCISFTCFDACYRDICLNNTYVQCLIAGDEKQSIGHQVLLQLTCKITKQKLELFRTGLLLINRFGCTDWGNLDHCLDVRGDAHRRMLGRQMLTFISKDGHTSSKTANDERCCERIIQCFTDAESFQGVYLMNRGLIVSITGTTIEGYLSQAAEQGNYYHIIKEIIDMRRSGNTEPRWELYLRNIVCQGLEVALSSGYLDISKVAHIVMPYIQYYTEVLPTHVISERIEQLVALFAAHKRLNVFLGYIVQGYVTSLMKENVAIKDVMTDNVLRNINAETPYVILRLALTVNFDIDQLRRMIRLLKQFLLAELEDSLELPVANNGCSHKCRVSCKVKVVKHEGNYWTLSIKDTKWFDLHQIYGHKGFGRYSNEKSLQFATLPKSRRYDTILDIDKPSVAHARGDYPLVDGYYLLYDQITRGANPIGLKRDTHISSCNALSRSMLLRELQRIDLEHLGPHVATVGTKQWSPSDYELLSFQLHWGKGGVGEFARRDYGPPSRAAIMAVATLLSRVGKHKESFVFNLHAQSQNALALANILCDTEPGALHDVMSAAIQLYRINPQVANILMVEKFNTGTYIDQVVQILASEPKHLFSYLNGIHSEAKLPHEYLPLYLGLIAIFKPTEIISFLILHKRNVEMDRPLADHFIRLLREARRIHRLGDLTTQCPNIQTELYMAEAFVGWVGHKPWDVVYTSVMMALRLELMSRDNMPWKHLPSSYIHKRLVELLHKVFEPSSVAAISRRVVKECGRKWIGESQQSNDAIELYLYHIRYSMGILDLQHRQHSDTIRDISKKLLTVAKRGIVFSGTQTNPTQDGVVVANCTYVCAICNSASIATHSAVNRIAQIIRTVQDRCTGIVTYLEQPVISNTLYFFCGHIAHEYCQVRVINAADAMLLRSGQRDELGVPRGKSTTFEQSGDDHLYLYASEAFRRRMYTSDSLRYNCLACLHSMDI
ncbi:transcriptional regulator, putative [Babesia ovis]|uniref:Transcriptional regulator, putative n=1 Tax=Babesia ovis TaxID=5869 RepID=A0A9W5WUW6_BABOV|nr:transcriptional regulator, putative [Babesia ovis]